ncbi:LysR family transcriptional regulator [Alkalibacterium sp. f15]|uniref:LysR family transcriptional regulator n=1 Tax=Alkalibacterium sp. f15 TaxID=3414029 RepID=UPI003BF8203D
MKLNDLLYFRHLAETRSFSETADLFYLSQPTVSIALKRLEDEYNTTLITRNHSKKSVELTDSGQIVYQSALDILNILETVKEKISNMETQDVYFGLLPTIGSHYLPKIMPHLTAYLDNLHFTEEESSDLMYEKVKKGEIPAAIVGSDQPFFEEEWLTQIPIAENELYLWVSPTHPLARRKRVKPKDLKNLSLVTLAKGYTHQRMVDDWAKKNDIDFKRIHYANEIQTSNSMVASGMSASLMIDLLVRDRSDMIKIPLEDSPKFYIRLIINNKVQTSTYQKQFNTHLIKVINKEFN